MKEFAFPKSLRLLKREDFNRVFSQSKPIRGNYFLVLFHLKRSGLHSRIGLMIKKRDFKRAVMRNYIKRSARENFRRFEPKFQMADLVLISRKRSRDLLPPTREMLRNDLLTIFNSLQSAWN